MVSKAVGIDLGTTNSSMAIVIDGKPEIIQLGTNDDRVLRSALYFSTIGGQNRVFYGNDAINRGTEVGKVEYFKQDFKRDMARGIVNETPGSSPIDATILSALLLHQFKKRLKTVSQELGVDDISDAVITVPAYFTSEQRLATKRAGKLAGFNVLRIINEPTAAAISYASSKKISGNILVYDLGGGTFDVTVMNVSQQDYHILATDGDHRLGGIDFDKALVKLIKEKFEQQGLNMTMLTPKEEMQLRYQAEKLKTQLSIDESVFCERSSESGDYGIEITRDEFNSAVSVLVKDTELKMNQTLAASGLTWEAIDHILLVSGATRMPIIRQMVSSVSRKTIHYDLNPDTIVAEGASLIANLLANQTISFSEKRDGFDTNESMIQVQDVTSQGIGLLFKKSPYQRYDFGGDFTNSVIVSRNTPVPYHFEKDLFAVANNQNNFRLRVTEGNYANPINVKVILDQVVNLPSSYQTGDKIGKAIFELSEEQLVVISIVDMKTQAVISRFQANAKMSQQTVEEDLLELQAIFEQYIV